MKVKDRVVIIDDKGNQLAEGIIININEYREPSAMYAVIADGYDEDVLFFGESQLKVK